MVNLHDFSAFRIWKSQKTFCHGISFFLSKSNVDPKPITRKVTLSNTQLPFIHSMVSNILCGKRIGFTLWKKKTTDYITYYQRGSLEKIMVCILEVWIVDWFQGTGFLSFWFITLSEKNKFGIKIVMYDKNEEILSTFTVLKMFNMYTYLRLSYYRDKPLYNTSNVVNDNINSFAHFSHLSTTNMYLRQSLYYSVA